jgi:hypothetical protein
VAADGELAWGDLLVQGDEHGRGNIRRVGAL